MNLLRFLGLCVVLACAIPSPAAASAPGATTGDATNITSVGATLNGVANPNKEDTVVYFEYGTTTGYGARTPDDVATGNAGKDISAAITGLTPNTVYHFRLVATNPSGTDMGVDKTFTTLASPYVIPSTVTATANPTAITFGASSTIAGQLTGPTVAAVTVNLQETPFPFSAPFSSPGAAAVTDATGAYAFTVAPAIATRYQVVAQTTPPATSPTVEVAVRHKVTFRVSDARVRRGQRVRFKGTVGPAHESGRVRIQRRTKRGFKTIARAALRTADGAAKSTYRKRIRIRRKGTYRVRFGADAGHLTGTSRKRTIRIG